MTEDNASSQSPNRSRRPRRYPTPWWALTLMGAGIGFLSAEWVGMIFGGLLGFFAWKLR